MIRIAYAMPYAAMILGLFIMKSAWLAFILYHAGILFFLIKEKQLGKLPLLIRGWNTRLGLQLILFCMGGGALIFLLWPYLGLENLAGKLALFGLSGISWTLFVIYHSTVNSWFEEFFWRGYLGSKNPKLAITDLLFAGYHVPVLYLFLAWHWVIVSFAILLMASWLWRQIYAYKKGLLMPVISHIVADGSIMMVLYFTV